MKIKRYNDNNLNDFKIQKKGFIIWANHPIFHAECTPGYTKLLLELNYSVDIVMIENAIQERALCLMEHEDLITTHIFQNTEQLIEVLFKEAPKASGLMVTTGGLFYPNEKVAKLENKEITPHIKKLLEILNLPKFSILIKLANSFEKNVFIFHKTWQLNEEIRPLLGERIVNNAALLFKSKTMPEIPMINPHYFGGRQAHTQNKTTTFTVIGEIRKDKRNYVDLIDSAIKLNNKGYDFIINIIGKGEIDNLPKEIQNKCNIMGYLEFNEMYTIIEKSDFILPLFDSTIEEQKTYANEKTSGSIQLIYGFTKIPIIENTFSTTHQFTNKNAIIYDTKELFTGMEEAINMTETIYNTLQNELTKLSEKIHKESIKNLKRIINKKQKKSS